jgi:hypothetical protein
MWTLLWLLFNTFRFLALPQSPLKSCSDHYTAPNEIFICNLYFLTWILFFYVSNSIVRKESKRHFFVFLKFNHCNLWFTTPSYFCSQLVQMVFIQFYTFCITTHFVIKLTTYILKLRFTICGSFGIRPGQECFSFQ